jgi:glucuronate isomerase
MPKTLRLDPDRLFPSDPETRACARTLYKIVADLPIVSPHGHVDPVILVENTPFADPAQLFLRYDHYVTRVLHAAGFGLGELGIPTLLGGDVADPREAWRIFCSNWLLFAGTASGYWLQHEFVDLFGITEHPCEDNADALYDQIIAALQTEAFRPRALFESFGIDVLATTDDPMDDLAAHAALRADPSFTGRVVPTFRPDNYLNPATPGWSDRVAALAAWNGTAAADYDGYLGALAGRRRYFVEHGAVSSDHGVTQPFAAALSHERAAQLFAEALAGRLDAEGARIFSGHMLLESARMSLEDGLVMTVHAGIVRNHDSGTFERFGPDTGHDIPVATSYVESLRPLLERYGNDPSLHLVLFAVDETVYSRELAPLAGYYPAVYIGAPWWFLDAPDAVLRFRAATTETAGFYRGSGFIDDTRAFLSIPARHDMSRRLDASFLARLVREGRIDRQSAEQIIYDLVAVVPRKVFKL